jgi:hypothetical protein
MNQAIENLKETLLKAINECREAMIGDLPGKPRPGAPLDQIATQLLGVQDTFMLKMEIDQIHNLLQLQMKRKGLSAKTLEIMRNSSECLNTVQNSICVDIGQVITPDDLALAKADGFGGLQLGDSLERKLFSIEKVIGHILYCGNRPGFVSGWEYRYGIHDGLFPHQSCRIFGDMTDEMLHELPIDPKEFVIARRVARGSLYVPWGILLDKYKLEMGSDPVIFPPDLSWILCLDHGYNGIFAKRDRGFFLT